MSYLSDLGICTTTYSWYLIKSVNDAEFRNSSLGAKTTYFQLSKGNETTYSHAIIWPGDLILQVFYKII